MSVVDLFHHKIQGIIRSSCDSLCISEDLPVASMLAESGACIGRAREIVAKDDMRQKANLHMVLVAPSGGMKSPCLSAFFQHVRNHDTEQFLQAEMTGGWPRQVIVDESSQVALYDILAANPRGVLWYQDEAEQHLRELSTRGFNKDKSEFLRKLYDSSSHRVSKAKRDRCFNIPEATASFIGAIQPKRLFKIFAKEDFETGTVPRLSFVFDNTQSSFSRWSDAVFDPERHLKDITERLLSFELSDSGKSIGIDLSPQALDIFKNYHDELMERADASHEPSLREVLSKHPAKLLRLCLNLHCLDAVCEERSEMGPVAAETMERACVLARWLLSHSEKLLGMVVGSRRWDTLDAFDRKVAKTIVDLGPSVADTQVRVAEIVKALGAQSSASISKSVGRSCVRLGLNHGQRRTDGRTYFVSSDDIRYFTNMLERQRLTVVA